MAAAVVVPTETDLVELLVAKQWPGASLVRTLRGPPHEVADELAQPEPHTVHLGSHGCSSGRPRPWYGAVVWQRTAPALMEALNPREGGQMPAPRKYPQELGERAMRLVDDAHEQEPGLSLNEAVLRIGPRVGINMDTLRRWCAQVEIDSAGVPA